MFLFLFFYYYCDRPCHSRSFNPILSITQQITTLSHTQQKLISRWGIGKHTDITKSGSNGVFAKVTENNLLRKNLHNIASFTIYVSGSFEE